MGVSATAWAKVVELRTERAKIATEAQSLYGKVELEKRSTFTAEEKETFDKHVKRVDELGIEIETREKLWNAMAVEEEEVQKIPPHLRNRYKETGAVNELEKRQVDCLLEYFKGDRNAHQRPEYRDVWGQINGRQQQLETRDTQLTTPSSGGFLMLPEQMSNRLIKKVDDMMWMNKFVEKIMLRDTKTLGSPSIDIEMDDLSWTTEIATITENTGMTFGKRNLVMNPFRTMIKVSDMWLETITTKDFFTADDNNGIGVSPLALIENRLAYHMARTRENAYFNGNGVGKPLGVFVASTRGIPTTRDVDQGASLSYNGLINAKYNLKMQYHKEAVWIFHRLLMAVIMKLVDSNNRPLLNFSTLPTQPDTLLGNPIYLSEFTPSTISNGSYVGLFGCLRFYWTLISPYKKVKIVDQLFAQTAQTAFFAHDEGDGMPILDEAFSRLKISA